MTEVRDAIAVVLDSMTIEQMVAKRPAELLGDKYDIAAVTK